MDLYHFNQNGLSNLVQKISLYENILQKFFEKIES